MNTDSRVQTIVRLLQDTLPDKPFIALHEPYFVGNEQAYVTECITTGWVSSVGKFVDRFETMLQEYTGIAHAVATGNGTAALHICLKLAGVESGDEVLLPDLTFVATANAVTYCNAIPHFVDCEYKTLGLDPHKLRQYLAEIAEVKDGNCYNRITHRRIRAVVPMHTFGHPVDLDPLVEVCQQFQLQLVEDAAESLGSYYQGKHTGSFGLVAALSFNGNKVVTTGGGGAILTNDAKLAQLAKHLTTTAKVPHRWEFYHDMIGYNYRLPNINAALGCAQLEQLPGFLNRKRALALRYAQVFAKVSGVQFVTEPEFAHSNYWLNTLLLDEDMASVRDALLETGNDQGIMLRPAWDLLHTLPMFKACPKMDLAAAEDLARRLVNIPSSASLGEVHG